MNSSITSPPVAPFSFRGRVGDGDGDGVIKRTMLSVHDLLFKILFYTILLLEKELSLPAGKAGMRWSKARFLELPLNNYLENRVDCVIPFLFL